MLRNISVLQWIPTAHRDVASSNSPPGFVSVANMSPWGPHVQCLLSAWSAPENGQMDPVGSLEISNWWRFSSLPIGWSASSIGWEKLLAKQSTHAQFNHIQSYSCSLQILRPVSHCATSNWAKRRGESIGTQDASSLSHVHIPKITIMDAINHPQMAHAWN